MKSLEIPLSLLDYGKRGVKEGTCEKHNTFETKATYLGHVHNFIDISIIPENTAGEKG